MEWDVIVMSSRTEGVMSNRLRRAFVCVWSEETLHPSHVRSCATKRLHLACDISLSFLISTADMAVAGAARKSERSSRSSHVHDRSTLLNAHLHLISFVRKIYAGFTLISPGILRSSRHVLCESDEPRLQSLASESPLSSPFRTHTYIKKLPTTRIELYTSFQDRSMLCHISPARIQTKAVPLLISRLPPSKQIKRHFSQRPSLKMANIHTPIPNLKLNDGNSIPMVPVFSQQRRVRANDRDSSAMAPALPGTNLATRARSTRSALTARRWLLG